MPPWERPVFILHIDGHSALSALSGAIGREGISYIRAITTLVHSLVQCPQRHAVPCRSGCVDITWFSFHSMNHSELCSFAAQSFAPSHSLHYICIRGNSPFPPPSTNARRSSRTSAMCTPVANLISPSEYAKCAHDFLWKESRGFFHEPHGLPCLVLCDSHPSYDMSCSCPRKLRGITLWYGWLSAGK